MKKVVMSETNEIINVSDIDVCDTFIVGTSGGSAYFLMMTGDEEKFYWSDENFVMSDTSFSTLKAAIKYFNEEYSNEIFAFDEPKEFRNFIKNIYNK